MGPPEAAGRWSLVADSLATAVALRGKVPGLPALTLSADYALQRGSGDGVVYDADAWYAQADYALSDLAHEINVRSAQLAKEAAKSDADVIYADQHPEVDGKAATAAQAVFVSADMPALHKIQVGASDKTAIEVRGGPQRGELYIDGRPEGHIPRRVSGLMGMLFSELDGLWPMPRRGSEFSMSTSWRSIGAPASATCPAATRSNAERNTASRASRAWSGKPWRAALPAGGT